MRFVFLFLVSLWGTSVFGSEVVDDLPKDISVARYDLGRMSGNWEFSAFPISGLEVNTVPWLDNPSMQFRLEFDDKWRRRSHPKSEWVASPSELLNKFLTRRIVFNQPDPKGRGCYLLFSLTELEQTFERPDSSFITFEALANVMAKANGNVLAKRAIYMQKKVTSPDVVGYVSATRESFEAFSSEIGEWLSETAKRSPEITRRCKASVDR